MIVIYFTKTHDGEAFLLNYQDWVILSLWITL